MIRTRKGKVVKILRADGDIVEMIVAVDGGEARAVAYPRLTGKVRAGDEVLLNTTAVALALGSGGLHFVISGPATAPRDFTQPDGHIMKLNYTPLQAKVLSVEEPDSPSHEIIADFKSLGGVPVIAGTLHSMLAPVCAAVRLLAGETARIVYVMTDAACLPLAFSRTVKFLKEKGLLDGTVTYGHAFGGDLEAVNKYTALIAARKILGADVIVAATGVGSIGTGTEYGHTGLEQGEITNAAAVLGGAPVGLLRISFADPRERHRGVSHHSLTALGKVAVAPVVAPVPIMGADKTAVVHGQLGAAGIIDRHKVWDLGGEVAFDAMKKYELDVRTMGRGPYEDPEFFLSCGAAAQAAVRLFNR